MPEPIATPAVPAAPAAAPVTPPAEGSKPGAPAEEMYVVKVNGEERKMTRAQIIERAQKAEGAEAAMKSSAEMEKAFNNFVTNAQDPEKLLQLLQHPSMKYDEEKQEILVSRIMASKSPRVINAVKKWLYDNEIAPAMMDPKERELAEKNARLAKYEQEEKSRTEKEQTTAREIAVQKKWTEYRNAIGEAVKVEGLPQNEGVVARMARYALLATKAGKPVDMADCAKRVKADLTAEYEARMNGLTEDNILDHVPAGIAEMINRALIKRLKGEPNKGAPEPKKNDPNAPSLNDALREISRGRKVYGD